MRPPVAWVFPHLQKRFVFASHRKGHSSFYITIYLVPYYRAAAIKDLLTMAAPNPALTNTGEFQVELDIHYRGSTAQQRTNHYSPGRTGGLADCHHRPGRCGAPAWAGPGLACSACSLGDRRPSGLNRRGLRGLGLAGLLGWLFRRLFGRRWRWLDHRLC